MQTHEQLVARLMRRRGVRKEVEHIEREEGELLDMICGEWVFGTKSSARQKEINKLTGVFKSLVFSVHVAPILRKPIFTPIASSLLPNSTADRWPLPRSMDNR